MNHAKLVIPSHSEQLWWEKIGKVANRVKSPITSHSEPYFGGKRLEKLQIGQNWPFRVILSHTLVGKDWESCNSGEIDHFKSF